MTLHNNDNPFAYFLGLDEFFLLMRSVTVGEHESVSAIPDVGVCPRTIDGIAFLHEIKWVVELHLY